MKGKIIAGSLALLLVCAACTPVRALPPIIRLHVLARSDSEQDQAQKLVVRDAVLGQAQELLRGCEDAAQAYATLDEQLSQIEKTARQAAGSADVCAKLGTEHYPDRDYGSFTLPEGDYLSLRVEIGPAQGQNWWCVVYPSLCMPGADAQAIPALLEPRPLRSVVWQWLTARWEGLFQKSEALEHA
ncbi:MAG: stage II sporulation protein R [Eubacteriales bacterium]|nr:stage II sporulation protein R [Eubacteriales bacterium]